ncbi:MAG: hypothetical protein MK066_01740 [Crocinitomicaceae bacterium]|nr:hypothetical protein [Crocinitomicaceae bacterium]
MKRFKFFITVSLLLLLTSCNRGCTTSKTIDSEFITHKTHGGDVKVVARLIDYRNSRRANQRNILKRKISHTYGIAFDLIYRGYELKEFFREGISSNTTDLKFALSRVSIRLSKDKKHLGIGVDNNVIDVLHFLKNKPIPIESSTENMSYSYMTISGLDMESFPDPEKMIMENFLDECGKYSLVDKQGLFSFFDSFPSSDTIHRTILSTWPDCRLSKEYLSSERLRKFRKNGTWCSYLRERGRQALNESEFFRDEVKMFETLRAVNDSELNSVLDSVLCVSWGRKRSEKMIPPLLQRLVSGGNKMSPVLVNNVLDRANRGFLYFRTSGESDSKNEVSQCLQIIAASGDTISLYRFVEMELTNKFDQFDEFDLIEVVYDNYDLFTPYQQGVIKNVTLSEFDGVKNYLKYSFFEAVTDIIECKQLRAWKEAYPEDLDDVELPESC